MIALRATVAAIVLAGLLVNPVAAAEPTFGPATASAQFGTGITVEQRATLPAGIHRVEALVRTTGSRRTLVSTIPTPGQGQATLRYTFDTPLGGLFPNTVVEVGFRVTLDDGTVFEGPTATVRYQDSRFEWRTLDGKHVRVHWSEGGEAFGRRVVAIGDEAVERASALLGVEPGDLIDFFVYADDAAFQDVLGPASRENVGGVAPQGLRTLFASIGSTNLDDPWVGIVVPHELAHVVFEAATANPYHEPPAWLNEGLAVYLAEGYSLNRRASVERAVAGRMIMPLTALAGRFPTTAERFGLAYGESVAAVDYMVRTFGQDALVNLIRSYRDGVADDAAFEAALGLGVAAFQESWYADLGVDAPVPYGPQPAPAGPVPADWEGSPPTPGPSGAPPTPEPDSGPSGDSGAGVLGLALLGIGGLLVLAAVALAMARRRRESTTEALEAPSDETAG